MTFVVRPARLADAEMIAALLREAFGGAEEATPVAALRAEGAIVAELVAGTAEGITGHILFSAAPNGRGRWERQSPSRPSLTPRDGRPAP